MGVSLRLVLLFLALVLPLAFPVATMQVLEVTMEPSNLTQSVSPASPQVFGTMITFTCNYTNSTGPLDQSLIGNNCSVMIDGSEYPSTYNAADEVYRLANNSIPVGDHAWYCSCESYFFDNQNGPAEGYTIQSSGGDGYTPAPDRVFERHILIPLGGIEGYVNGRLCVGRQISFKVEDNAGGIPVGAPVNILHYRGFWEPYGSSVVGPEGRIYFIPLLEGIYELEVGLPNYFPGSTQVNVEECPPAPGTSLKDLYLPCSEDGECRSGVCSQGTCQALRCECGRIVGSICVNYGCCSDDDCDSYSMCRQNRCERKQTCASSRECEADKHCMNGFCERIRCLTPDYILDHACVIECLSDEDCGQGQECYKSRCLRIMSEEERQVRIVYKPGAKQLCTTDGLGSPLEEALVEVTLPDGSILSVQTPESGCISTATMPLGELEAKARKERYMGATLRVSMGEREPGQLVLKFGEVLVLSALVIPLLAVLLLQLRKRYIG